MNAEGEE